MIITKETKSLNNNSRKVITSVNAPLSTSVSAPPPSQPQTTALLPSYRRTNFKNCTFIVKISWKNIPLATRILFVSSNLNSLGKSNGSSSKTNLKMKKSLSWVRKLAFKKRSTILWWIRYSFTCKKKTI